MTALADSLLDSTELLASRVDLENFLHGMIGFDGEERRADPRYPLGIVVRATPVDAAMQPLGPPLVTVARDVSGGGIALWYCQPITARWLVIELNSAGEQMKLVLQVLRSRQIAEWCHEVAGRFVPWQAASGPAI